MNKQNRYTYTPGWVKDGRNVNFDFPPYGPQAKMTKRNLVTMTSGDWIVNIDDHHCCVEVADLLSYLDRSPTSTRCQKRQRIQD